MSGEYEEWNTECPTLYDLKDPGTWKENYIPGKMGGPIRTPHYRVRWLNDREGSTIIKTEKIGEINGKI